MLELSPRPSYGRPGAAAAGPSVADRHLASCNVAWRALYSEADPPEKPCTATSVSDSDRLGGMFVIELIYKADLAQIDAQMKAHMVFLRKHYTAGHFLISGRKVPRDGGVIIAIGKDKPQIEAIMREDPFVAQGLAEFRIIEFRPSQRATDIQTRIDAEPVRG